VIVLIDRMMIMMMITYIAITIINIASVLCYAITSFGSGVVYQLGWHLCTIIDSSVCDGALSTAVIHVTLAHVFTFPMQIYILRHRVNWSLAFLLTISQQAGLYGGLFLLFSYQSIWFYRGLALLFFLITVDMIYKELSIILNENGIMNKHQINMTKSNDSDDNSINKIKIDFTTDNIIGDLYGGGDIVEMGIGGNVSFTKEDKSDKKASDENSLSTAHQFFTIDTYSKFFITLFTGLTSGISGGLFSIGGPSLMWFISFYNLNSVECRATLAVAFWCENIGRLIYIFFLQNNNDVWTEQAAILFAILSISSICTLLLGNYLSKFVNQNMFRRMQLILVAAGSVLMAINGLNPIRTLIVSVLSLLFLGIIFATSYFVASKKSRCINMLCCLDSENEIDKSLDQFINSDSSDDDDKEMNTLFGNKRTKARIGSPANSPTKKKESVSMFQRSLYSVLTTEENNDEEKSDNVLF